MPGQEIERAREWLAQPAEHLEVARPRQHALGQIEKRQRARGLRRGGEAAERMMRRDTAVRVLRLRQELEQLAGRIAVAGDELRGGGRARLGAEAPGVVACAARTGREHRASHARHPHQRLVAALAGPGKAAGEHLVGGLERRAVAVELVRFAGPRASQPTRAVPLEHADGALQLVRIDAGRGHDPEGRGPGAAHPHARSGLHAFRH